MLWLSRTELGRGWYLSFEMGGQGVAKDRVTAFRVPTGQVLRAKLQEHLGSGLVGAQFVQQVGLTRQLVEVDGFVLSLPERGQVVDVLEDGGELVRKLK
jgi:hypothetical protein